MGLSRSFADLPLDILQPILAHLSDRRDWHACTLVDKEFNEVATPLLYRKLDSRVQHVRPMFLLAAHSSDGLDRPSYTTPLQHSSTVPSSPDM